MTTLSILGVVLLIGGWWAYLMREKRVEEMRELRFPTLSQYFGEGTHGHTFADFGEMLLVAVSGHFAENATRVYHLRRRDGPTWERCEEWASRERGRARLAEDSRSDLFLKSDLEKRAADLSNEEWHAVQFPTLEVSYQRFVAHYRPVSLRTTPVAFALELDAETVAKRAAKAGATKV